MSSEDTSGFLTPPASDDDTDPSEPPPNLWDPHHDDFPRDADSPNPLFYPWDDSVNNTGDTGSNEDDYVDMGGVGGPEDYEDLGTGGDSDYDNVSTATGGTWFPSLTSWSSDDHGPTSPENPMQQLQVTIQQDSDPQQEPDPQQVPGLQQEPDPQQDPREPHDPPPYSPPPEDPFGLSPFTSGMGGFGPPWRWPQPPSYDEAMGDGPFTTTGGRRPRSRRRGRRRSRGRSRRRNWCAAKLCSEACLWHLFWVGVALMCWWLLYLILRIVWGQTPG
ncbi:membrane protein UL56 [Gallid alphaherpesvirus 1]|nr:membrane protein UL56 [Gallid alphaherpesvirus 1]